MIAGGFDYLLKVRSRDMADYRRIMAERLSALPHVASTSSYVAMEAVVEQGAAPRAVPGVVGEVDRQHRPHLVTEALQREDGRRVADVAVGHRGLDREDAHGTSIGVVPTPDLVAGVPRPLDHGTGA